MNDVTDHANILKEIGSELSRIGKLADSESFDVSFNSDLEKGDISSNVSLKHFKQMGYGSPMEAAEKIAAEYTMMDDPCIEKVEAAVPGFVNFFLSKTYLESNLSQVLKEKESYGNSDINKGKKVVVEFSSPNIAKPFTIGHLRSTIIGNAISNLLSAVGWEVFTDNHVGDWGTQFGKQIYAIKEWGDFEKIEQSENPVKELVSLYVRFHEEAEKKPELEDAARVWFKKLEEGDPEAKKLWQKCVDLSWKEFEKLYGTLDISFTENAGRGYGESFFEDKMEPIVKELKDKNLLKEDKGAQMVYFENDMYPPLMVLKQDGASLYSTRDLATDKFRLNTYGDDVMIINEVGAEQSLYFNQLYALEKMLGWVKNGQRIHVRHGLYRFKDMKMSTRKGNTIWLEDVLQEAIEKAKKLGNENLADQTAIQIGVGALKWNDLKRDPVSDITFEWDDVLSMNGNSGPYMQYTYARTQSVLSKVNVTGTDFKYPEQQSLNNEELSLLRMLVHYPEIVSQAGSLLSTSILCNYLYVLAQEFNVFYEKHKVISSENEQFRVALTAAVGQVLKNGLTLLGIPTPQKI